MNRLPRRLATLSLGALLLGTQAIAHAQDKKPDDAKQHDNEKEQPIPPEKSSVTHHEITLDGKTIHYTATAGTLLIRDEEEKPYGSIFYIAYTQDGVDAKSRPVTFLYNGGPGAATLWLHMGSVGPVRVTTSSPAATGAGPYQVVPNQYSLLDKTDLVFIDAPLTGYSRAVGKSTPKDFAGVDQDLKAFDKFIERYLVVNQRWNSPKFLFGESYGTTRSAGLSAVLQENGVSLNGIVLLSSILNYGELAAGMDTQYINNLPSYAAIAWYHNKLQNKPADLKPFLEEVRGFARGDYSEALAEGDQLPPAKLDAIAAKVNQYTGLSVQYVKDAKLRVSPTRFRKELLRGEGDILGRYDARFEGTDVDNAGEYPGYDPSDTGISGAFVAAENDYLTRELKYETTDTYRPSANSIGEWDWKHRGAGAGRGFGGQQAMPYVAGDLADTIRKNPKLKVMSANGYFDLATPFFATEYDLSHMMLTPDLAKNVEFTYYPSGHMVYLNVDALKDFKHDLDNFYSGAAK
ncbi:S10 family peptidase [Acidobacterium sp. S8]|uniref:S10 family peptidase n=1 Tax=Acidobacterium sp. S8 TaxID=1641854 RepID=UPI00131D6111|nr:peptidase S10 [Acidobacterium sp. S8]